MARLNLIYFLLAVTLPIFSQVSLAFSTNNIRRALSEVINPSTRDLFSSDLSKRTENDESTLQPRVDNGLPDRTRGGGSSSGQSSKMRYIIVTRKKTDKTAFKQFVKEVDGGKGMIMSAKISKIHVYTSMLSEKNGKFAMDAWKKKKGFGKNIDKVLKFDPRTAKDLHIPDSKPMKKIKGGRRRRPQKRADGPFNTNPGYNQEMYMRTPSQAHLKMISQGRNSQPGADYLFNRRLGRGRTIYILDSGCAPHNELARGNRANGLRGYAVPNTVTGGNTPDSENWQFDWENHGTGVASLAGGLDVGVASSADLVCVKFKSHYLMPEGAEEDLPVPSFANGVGDVPGTLYNAFLWILNDIDTNPNLLANGRSFVQGSVDQQDNNPQSPTYQTWDWFRQQCEQRGVMISATAGEEGGRMYLHNQPFTMDNFVPQSLATRQSGIVASGGVDARGRLVHTTTPVGHNGGQILVYALGEQVWVADANMGAFNPNAYDQADGVSFASAQIGGLMAYLSSLHLARLQGNGHQAYFVNMKRKLDDLAWQRSANQPSQQQLGYPAPQQVKVAYNGAWEEIRPAIAPAPSRGGGGGPSGRRVRRDLPSKDGKGEILYDGQDTWTDKTPRKTPQDKPRKDKQGPKTLPQAKDAVYKGKPAPKKGAEGEKGGGQKGNGQNEKNK
ncbi:MAG: hypothetical protein M1820_002862 [Bogoriella megaspora]|nr:MAG: hypothetical protein M1820_002862 [Bogoriella megaspora]